MPHRQHGKKKTGIRRPAALTVATALLLSACVSSNFGQSATTGAPAEKNKIASGAQKQGQAEGPSFAEFRDVPLPANASIDFDNLLVLGAEDGWIGRLALDVGYSMPDMYAFYEREMPRFGWVKITSVRAAISTMTYSRGNRIATVTLHSRTTGGTAIDFTVAPANPHATQGNLPQSTATPPSPARTAPVTTSPASGASSG